MAWQGCAGGADTPAVLGDCFCCWLGRWFGVCEGPRRSALIWRPAQQRWAREADTRQLDIITKNEQNWTIVLECSLRAVTQTQDLQLRFQEKVCK